MSEAEAKQLLKAMRTGKRQREGVGREACPTRGPLIVD